MAKVCLMSYANKNFIKNQKRLNKSAKKYKIKNIISYTDSDLKKTKFYDKYKGILDKPRGAGYWLWKPFFIYKTLKLLNDGDVLIYSDSGAIFVNSPLPLLKMLRKNNILLFTNNETNIKWNKNICLIKMCCDSEKYYNAKQVAAGFQIYVNNERTRNFVKEWLYYCCMPGLIDDTISEPGECMEFREHRHDQSIITNLATRYNIPLYRDPSQGGNYLKPKKFRKRNDWLAYPYRYEAEINSYPTIINHLRGASRTRLLLIKLHNRLPRWLKRLKRK